MDGKAISVIKQAINIAMSDTLYSVQERPSIKMLKGDCCSESKYQYTLPIRVSQKPGQLLSTEAIIFRA